MILIGYYYTLSERRISLRFLLVERRKGIVDKLAGTHDVQCEYLLYHQVLVPWRVDDCAVENGRA